jgi:hypothetical protein
MRETRAGPATDSLVADIESEPAGFAAYKNQYCAAVYLNGGLSELKRI